MAQRKSIANRGDFQNEHYVRKSSQSKTSYNPGELYPKKLTDKYHLLLDEQVEFPDKCGFTFRRQGAIS